MSRIIKIAAASATILALIGIASPAQAAPTIQPMGGSGCCISFH